jgi:hypothetical protein
MGGYTSAEKSGNGLACDEENAVLVANVRDCKAGELMGGGLAISLLGIKAHAQLDKALYIVMRTAPN